MEYGAHLPLIGRPAADAGRRLCIRAAGAALGYRFLCANDHLLFARPWLDGPTALAAALGASADMSIATTVVLPAIRGLAQTAKMLASIDRLSGGRLIAGVGPGSSPRDYAAVGLAFGERWKRFDETLRGLRSLLGSDTEDFNGKFYSTEGIALEPRPVSPEGPPIWVASWGPAAGLRRVARLGDCWLASGYNKSPPAFRTNLALLSEQCRAAGKNQHEFPN